MRFLVPLILIALMPLLAYPAIDAYPFPNEELRARYNALIDELRCPQCLNTNLAGSDAMVAKDLRREVHRLVLEGKTDDEVRAFMLARYGDFILYKPQLKAGTMLLWFGPLALFLIALFFAIRIVRRPHANAELSSEEMQRINQLLNKNKSEK